MRFLTPLESGRLVRRYKRFLADIVTDQGEEFCIHCPNTGSMLNCLEDDAPLWFSRSTDPSRKLPGTWELVRTPQGRMAMIHAARANRLVEEALVAGVIEPLQGFAELKREVAYGLEKSRADFRLDYVSESVFVEVKNVTLGFADSDVAAFPDARTERGTKHLRELTVLAQQGMRAVQIYAVTLSDISAVRAAEEIDPVYAQALRDAKKAGVEILAYGAQLSEREVSLVRPLPVLI